MTSTFFNRIIFIVLLTGLGRLAGAQEYKYEIGGAAGGSFYMGDANKNTLFKGLHPSLGAVFRYNANYRVALKGNLTWGKVSGKTNGLDNVFPDNRQASFSRSLIDLGGQVEFNFMPYSDKYGYLNTRRFSPYLLAGLGLTVAPGNGHTSAGMNIPLGVGVKYKIKNRVNLGCEFSFRKLFGDDLDVTGADNAWLDDPYGIKSSAFKNKDWYAFLLFSVTWDFGPRNRPCNNKNSIGNFF